MSKWKKIVHLILPIVEFVLWVALEEGLSFIKIQKVYQLGSKCHNNLLNYDILWAMLGLVVGLVTGSLKSLRITLCGP